MAFTKALRAAIVTLAAGAFMAAAPASARGDVGTPVASAASATASDASLDSGQFGQLFGQWKQQDGDGALPGEAPREAASMPLGMPVMGATLTSGYGMRDHPVLRKRANHKGVDLAGPTGTPVYATADGTVEMAQWYSSYGKYVQIDHGGDVETRYAHLSSYTVAPGERVQRGQLIGYIGSTGRSTGPHLHYEIRVAGVAVNPIPYMEQQHYALNEGSGGMGGDEE